MKLKLGVRKLHRAAGAAAALALAAGGFALITAAPAGASGGPNPPTSPVSYEVDGYSASAGAAPMVVTTSGLTVTGATAPLYPAGQTYGLSGDVTFGLQGRILAGLIGSGFANTFSASGFHLTGDATSAGDFAIPAVSSQPLNLNTFTVSGVSWSSSSTTITAAPGTFTPAMINDGLSDTGLAGGSHFFQSPIASVSGDGSSATVVSAPSGTGSGTLTVFPTATYTESINTPTNAYTTSASGWTSVNGVTADVNLTASSPTFQISVPLSFSPATITGWTAGGAANGPGIDAGTGTVSWSSSPLYPAGVLNPLQSVNSVAQTFVTADSISVPLASSGPAPSTPTNVNLGVGGTKDVNLSAAASYGGSVESYNLVSTSPLSNNGNALSFTLTGNTLHLNDTGQSGVAVITIQWNATDNFGVTGSNGSVVVTIGTPPVDQPLTQVVNPGQLQVSCNAPGSPGYPELTCPVINLPAITLNGQSQTTTDPISTVYVSDNRGDPAAGWSLTTYMVATSSNTGEGGACSSYVGFCDATDPNGNPTTSAYDTANGKIAQGNLSIGTVAFAASAGNLNVAPTGAGGTYSPTAIALGSAAAGVSGGTFTMNGNFTLNIPSSVYAGTYDGTVEYLVQ